LPGGSLDVTAFVTSFESMNHPQIAELKPYTSRRTLYALQAASDALLAQECRIAVRRDLKGALLSSQNNLRRLAELEAFDALEHIASCFQVPRGPGPRERQAYTEAFVKAVIEKARTDASRRLDR